MPARCRQGQPRADHAVLRFSADRAGFERLDAWLAAQPGAVSLVAMESSGHDRMPLASHLRLGGRSVAVVNPLSAKYFAKRHPAPDQERSGRRACPGGAGDA